MSKKKEAAPTPDYLEYPPSRTVSAAIDGLMDIYAALVVSAEASLLNPEDNVELFDSIGNLLRLQHAALFDITQELGVARDRAARMESIISGRKGGTA